MGVDAKPAEIARQGLAKARAEDYDAVIVDTAGRLQVRSVSPLLLHDTPVQPARDAEHTEGIMLHVRAVRFASAVKILAAQSFY